MGIIGAFIKFVGGDDDSEKKQAIRFSIGMGLGGFRDQPCKPGRFYVYVHTDAEGTVFYVGKGTGDRAYSRDRPPEWNEYVSRKSGGKFSVKIVRDRISEDDALQIEDALMAEYATTIINRVNMHVPYDAAKMMAYAEAMRGYDKGLERAVDLSRAGKLDQAVAEFEVAYARYFDVIKNHDYDLGARRGLASTGFSFHPHALADRYTKALAKTGRHIELVAFAERYFRDYGEPSNRTEEGLKNRMEKARGKINVQVAPGRGAGQQGP
ncbi:MAG TPA: hypothetical protein VEN78_26545 [Bradyrhizobium sp.]|nr:hypothetical protein [Bradyrhizobium sp.]